MPIRTQRGRLIAIHTSLGEDVLLLNSFQCIDRISELFTIKAHVLVETANARRVTAAALIGKPVAITVRVREGQTRFFHGIVRRMVHSGKEETAHLFLLEIVPWFWLLTARHNCRIFQGKTIPEIVEEVFRGAGLTTFRMDLQKPHLPWDYCVQYRESDYAFVSRILEQEGIYFYFTHSDTQHDMILSDHPGGHIDCPFGNSLLYSQEAGTQGAIYAWEKVQELRPGVFTLRDHHMELPTQTLEVSEPSTVSIGNNGALEIYDYPGEYSQLFNKPEERIDKVREEGERIVRIRMEQEEAAHDTSTGSSESRVLAAGHKFSLGRHFNSAFNGDYIVTSVQHTIEQSPAYDTGQNLTRPLVNRFTCIPARVTYRPPRRAPKPYIQGPQTARVVGPENEEIWVDKYGRVKVQFFWDRLGHEDENSSCWIRVATPWAGAQWGMIHIPRIGQEVLVDFLEGDPDQPIVIGSLYNKDQMPPYDLPAKKTQSGVKSRSSLRGSSAHFNEIRFEDKKDHEEIYVHAEKNLCTVVEASETRTVGANRTTTIEKNDKLTVKKENLEITVEKGDRSSDILEGNDTISIPQGNSETQVPLGAYRVDAKEIYLTGTQMVKIVCGASTIEMTPASITIRSTVIKLNC